MNEKQAKDEVLALSNKLTRHVIEFLEFHKGSLDDAVIMNLAANALGRATGALAYAMVSATPGADEEWMKEIMIEILDKNYEIFQGGGDEILLAEVTTSRRN